MASPEKPYRPDAWLSKRQMCSVLDITPACFDHNVRRYVNPRHVKQDGRKLLFYCRGVLDSWYGRHRHSQSGGPASDVELGLLYLNCESWEAG